MKLLKTLLLKVNHTIMKFNFNQLKFNYINPTRIIFFAGIVVFCVITGGLFFGSHSGRLQITADSTSVKERIFYFTPTQLPDSLDFAGERVPLENFDVKEALDRELLSCANFHSQTILFLKKLPRYYSIIEPILKRNNIPDDFKYLALAESAFLDKAVSPAGAIGIWQFMKQAALAHGLEVNNEVDERFNIEKATQAACDYLNNSYNRYGNWTMVAASYNAGLNGIDKQIEIQDSKNYYDLLLNEETARYLFRILSLKLVMNDPVKYGFRVEEKDKYPIISVKVVKVTGRITDMANFAHSNGINYKILKYFNPWLRQPSLKNPYGKTYMLKIPEPGIRKFEFEDQTGTSKKAN
jgi:membrane-bound lytic murein transglycosylase D